MPIKLGFIPGVSNVLPGEGGLLGMHRRLQQLYGLHAKARDTPPPWSFLVWL